MEIVNTDYKDLNANDLFVCAVGYQPRSRYLLEKNIETRNNKNTLVIQFPCVEKQTGSIDNLYQELSIVEYDYEDTESVVLCIKKFFLENTRDEEGVDLYVDYSTMPRAWYCRLPILLKQFISIKKRIFFLYTAGEYPQSYESSQSAGINTISVFSGLTLPEADIKRYHILGLSYDNLRTETIKSILEPNLLIACYAFNKNNHIVKEHVLNLNERTIDNSLLSVGLPIGNMIGMINKLCEIVYDHIRKGQVIIVPDGPKPLIMAMSIIPDIVGREGVTCLHVSRNNLYRNEVLIKPRENEIFGFQVLNE